MGPIILFDKSILQGLSVDEAVWFDHFFIPNIAPIFFVETLADLEKAIKSGRTPEQEVGLIATKTPQLSGRPNVFHIQLYIADLLGGDIPMDGRIVISGGKPVRTSGRSGLVFDESPEEKAFLRWQEGQFLEVERKFAKNWRNMLKAMDIESILKRLNSIKKGSIKCQSLEDAKTIANNVVNVWSRPLEQMELAIGLLMISKQAAKRIFEHWNAIGRPPLKTFAPYASYVLTVLIFFYIASAMNLISSKRSSNRIDLAYLFYLPFCMVFTSSDHFHRRCAPLFLWNNQVFVWGLDLKADLKKINSHYEKLPESEKEKGVFSIAPEPPTVGGFLVSQLWDRFFPGWLSREKPTLPQNDISKEKEIEEMNKLIESTPLSPDEVDFDIKNPDSLVLQRKVQHRRGKWWQLPKGLLNKKGK